MLSREEVLNFINEVIVDNGGEVSVEDTLVNATGLDSFAITMLWLELEQEYKCFGTDYIGMTPKEEIQMDTLGDIINVIISKNNT